MNCHSSMSQSVSRLSLLSSASSTCRSTSRQVWRAVHNRTNAQYTPLTPPTRRNCRVESRRRCVLGVKSALELSLVLVSATATPFFLPRQWRHSWTRQHRCYSTSSHMTTWLLLCGYQSQQGSITNSIFWFIRFTRHGTGVRRGSRYWRPCVAKRWFCLYTHTNRSIGDTQSVFCRRPACLKQTSVTT